MNANSHDWYVFHRAKVNLYEAALTIVVDHQPLCRCTACQVADMLSLHLHEHVVTNVQAHNACACDGCRRCNTPCSRLATDGDQLCFACIGSTPWEELY